MLVTLASVKGRHSLVSRLVYFGLFEVSRLVPFGLFDLRALDRATSLEYRCAFQEAARQWVVLSSLEIDNFDLIVGRGRPGEVVGTWSARAVASHRCFAVVSS